MEPPVLPKDLFASLETALKAEEAPFLPYLKRELKLEWLEEDSDRLGNTHFELDHHDLYKRRRLRVSPGCVTIGLNPVLVEDQLLYRHTLIHELLHAAGLVDHSERHRELVAKLAPAPSLADSPTLQRLRDKTLRESDVKEWECGECGFVSKRRTIRRPGRCPQCAHQT